MPAFKTYQRTGRNLVTEQLFNAGMQYTDTPLQNGACKLLVNYNISTDGTQLTPRAGFHRTHTLMDSSLEGYRIHHSGYMQGLDTDFTEDFTFNYTLLYKDGAPPLLLYEDDLYEVHLLDNVEYIRIPQGDTGVLVHGIPYAATPEYPVYTVLNGRPILPINNGLGILECTRTMGVTAFTIRAVVPENITPAEAVEMGYNMLLEEPYSYTGEALATSTPDFIIKGILAKHPETGEVLLSGRKNQPVLFEAIYDYRAASTTEYIVRWVTTDLDNGTKSYSSYTIFSFDGVQRLTQIIPASYEKLSVAVEVYEQPEAESPLGDPVDTSILGAYTFTKENEQPMDPLNYPLAEARNMCTWKQRIVLWDLPLGKNILFVSRIDVANYFPYPHGAHVFDEDIIKCVPYLDNLLVFTQTKLYKLSWLPEGVGYKVNVVQENLILNQFDRNTVLTVQNMVFFKSGNYYYLVVPKSASNEVGVLQMAPISSAITNMLDNMAPVVSDTFKYLYGTDLKGPYTLVGYHNYLDTGTVRCVYKFKTQDDKYLDYILNYSTVLRTWTVYVMESTANKVLVKVPSVTEQTVYITLDGTSLIRIAAEVNTVEDTFLTETTYNNLQLIDTGYRDHGIALKKRYREVQFIINNTSDKSLQFGTQFQLDESTRKQLYNYAVTQVGDYLIVQPVYNDPALVGGAALLDDSNELYLEDTEYTTPSEDVPLLTNNWQLDVSSLNKPRVLKIRVKVSGKGYAPRFILVSLNVVPYTLLGYNWVYRTMNAR